MLRKKIEIALNITNQTVIKSLKFHHGRVVLVPFLREQNLSLQRDALEAAGCEVIYQDDGISGVTIERDGLTQAIGFPFLTYKGLSYQIGNS
jgi:hypothetical protein